MSIPSNLARPVALALGIATASGASLVLADPVWRTTLVWVGLLAIVWAVRSWSSRPASGELEAGAGKAARAGGSGSAPAAEAPSPAKEPAPRAAVGPTSGPAGSPAPRPAVGPTSTAAGSPGPGASPALEAGNGSANQRRFLALRRLTEQYLREVRRLNLVAVWGRDGTIPRKQALEQIRQIEARMRTLTERMKFVAGKAGE